MCSLYAIEVWPCAGEGLAYVAEPVAASSSLPAPKD